VTPRILQVNEIQAHSMAQIHTHMFAPGPCGVGCKSFSWANDTDRPTRWVQAAREGRLFIHGFFKYMW
jgi:hypothetical protein